MVTAVPITVPSTQAYIEASALPAWVRALRTLKLLTKGGYTLPVLGAVLLTPVDDGIRLTATNLKIGHSLILPGLLDDPLCITHADLLSFLAGASGDVTLEALPDGRVLGTAEGSTALMSAYDPDEYPVLPEAPEGDALTMIGPAFMADLARVIPAASTDSTRVVFTGVHIEMCPDGYRLAASDGFRLHVAHAYTDLPGSTAVLLPAVSAAYLVRALPKGDAWLRFSANKTQLHVSTQDGQEILCALLSEKFVTYQQILKGAHPNEWATVDTKATMAALKALKEPSKQTDQPWGNDAVRLSSLGDTLLIETPARHRELPCSTHEEDRPARPFSFMVNRAYLLDALAACGASAHIWLESPTKVILITSAEVSSLTALVMPVTLPK